MANKSPASETGKKQPQLTLKEKRAQKREKMDDSVIKTRKSR
ncbi:MAG: hypothetical protein ACOH1T_09815 [Microbacteriaceae bacterium]